MSLAAPAAQAETVTDPLKTTPQSSSQTLMGDKEKGIAGVFSGEEDGTFSDTVRFSLRNTAYHILNAIDSGKISGGITTQDIEQKAMEGMVVLPNVQIRVARLNENDPSDFALCGYSSTTKDSAKIGIIYRSDTDVFKGRYDCSPSSPDLNSILLKTTEVDNIVPAVLNSMASSITPIKDEAGAGSSEAPVVPSANKGQMGKIGLIVGGVIAGIIILISLIAFSTRTAGKIKESKQRNSKNVEEWETLIAKYESITREWVSYELDPVKILDMPLLSDMRNENTLAFHNALRLAKNLVPKNVHSVSTIDPMESSFAKAVVDLENSFSTAEIEAKRTLWSNFSEDERKRLQKAKDLLNIAMNSGASENERQSAYKRMEKELKGLIVMPKNTILLLEEKVNLLLTDGSEIDPNQKATV